MTIFEYTAINNPNATAQVVSHYGMKPDRRFLAKQLATCVARDRQNGEEVLSSIHPDLPLFQKQVDKLKGKWKSESEAKEKELFSNFLGFGSNKQETPKVEVKEESKSKQELMIIGGVILIGLAIIFKK